MTDGSNGGGDFDPAAFARIFEASGDALVVLDSEWRYVYVNAAAEPILGRAKSELIGIPVTTIFPEIVDTPFWDVYTRAMRENVFLTIEDYYAPLDTWFDIRVIPFDGYLYLHFRDTTQLHRVEDHALKTQERFSAILDWMDEGFLAVDRNWIVTYANRAAAHITGMPREEIVGRNHWDLWPMLRGTKAEAEYTHAVTERVSVHYERFSEAVGSWIEVHAHPIPDEQGGGLSIFFRNISQRKNDEWELQQSEQRYSSIFNQATVGIGQANLDGNFILVNDRLCEMLGRSREELLTLSIEAVTHPDDTEKNLSLFRHAVQSSPLDEAAQQSYSMDKRYIRPDGSVLWVSVSASVIRDPEGRPMWMQAVMLDITERIEAEAELRAAFDRQVAINRVGEAIRSNQEPAEVVRIALEALAKTLDVDRCLSIVLDPPRDRVTFLQEWHRPGLKDICGEYRFSSFDVDLSEIFPANRSLVVSDVHNGLLSAKSAETLAAVDIRALLDVPLSVEGEVVGVIGVYMADQPREWTSEEVGFVEAIASLIRSAAEASRMIRQIEARAEREALINRIGSAIRRYVDPADIQRVAAAEVGRALHADRCYFAVYNLLTGQVTIADDWRRPDLPPVSGIHEFRNTADMFRELYAESHCSVIVDADTANLSELTRENMRRLQLRSRLSVALADREGIMATFTAAMSDTPRIWTTDEVALIEGVATQLRSAIETARTQYRERRIAAELQAALQPHVPGDTPGLEIGAYMRPALDEAAIGGDFYDAFPIDENLYALVIGDVSGKGLMAASQVATVRNMLRGFLYEYRRPGPAATRLNQVLTAHNLLSGFVTLVVAVFTPATGAMVYTSCGHEPGIILSDGSESVSLLQNGGPPAGAVEDAEYAECQTQLDPGAMLVLYTDGLSEAGPTRSCLLGTEGLVRIVSQIPRPLPVEDFALRIVNEASAFATVDFRDDVCVLITRRTANS